MKRRKRMSRSRPGNRNAARFDRWIKTPEGFVRREVVRTKVARIPETWNVDDLLQKLHDVERLMSEWEDRLAASVARSGGELRSIRLLAAAELLDALRAIFPTND